MDLTASYKSGFAWIVIRRFKLLIPSVLLVCCVLMTCFILQSNLKESTPSFPRSVREITRQHIIPKTAVFNLTQPVFQIFPADTHLKDKLVFFTVRQEKVTLIPSEYRIPSSYVCRHNRDTTLLIIIPSVIQDSSTRMAIRDTWASSLYDSDEQQRPPVSLVFIFGDVDIKSHERTFLQREAELFHDIVTIDMEDSYHNLSLKIASSLQWSVNMCGHAKFVAKVDVDTMVNIPSLLLLLDHISPTDAIVLGYKHANKMPPVIRTGKWSVLRNVFVFPFYPRYVYGHSYVLTRSAVDRIVSAIPYFPIIPNEDAFVTGILSITANVTRVHSASFASLLQRQTCFDVLYGRFVTSLYSENNLRRVWSLLQSKSCDTTDLLS